jgi:hypothetical protein
MEFSVLNSRFSVVRIASGRKDRSLGFGNDLISALRSPSAWCKPWGDAVTASFAS